MGHACCRPLWERWRSFAIIVVEHEEASGAPAEVGGLHGLARVGVVVLIDGRTLGEALYVAEHLVGIGIGLLALAIVAVALNAIVGLVEPDGSVSYRLPQRTHHAQRQGEG